MAIEKPVLNEDVLDYDTLQTDEINRASADVPKAYSQSGWRVIEYPNGFVTLQIYLNATTNASGILGIFLPFRLSPPYSTIVTPIWSSTSDVKVTIQSIAEDGFKVRVSMASNNAAIINDT